MFPQLTDPDYSAIEREILDFWKREEIFRLSIESRPESRSWTFYEGPPTVNGVPGIHHVISRALKDMFCRYKTMQGYRVHRKAGWDTHGLPVEIALEKQLGLKEKGEIETKVGVAEFNRMAKELVFEHINRDSGWRELTEKMGYWLDLDDAYITCTNEYIESVWWALAQYFDKGSIYRGFKIVPQCPHCETPLSSHELAQGYKDVRDPSLYVKARIAAGATTYEGAAIPEGTSFLVWTTTPWTLISNVALAVGPLVEYVLVRTPEGEHYILADARRGALDADGTWEIVERYRGADLVGVRYERLFDYVAIAEGEEPRVVTGDFVSTEDGTGIVHIAPAFGQDDYEVYRRERTLPFLQPVTASGRFTAEVTPWAGRPVKTLRFEDRVEEGVDKEIVIELKQQGKVFKSSNDYLHSYPHCWRCDNPLIYYARDSWFIRTTEYSHQMVEENGRIRWQPEEIGSGRFGNWLEENKDWSLSRDRYWGTPLPIWVNENDANDLMVVRSIDELLEGEFQNADGTLVPMTSKRDELDLHKPFVDGVVFRRNGATYRRTPELIDVWFDSGAMPFAQWGYPKTGRDTFHARFPADFICEAIDQTRGWFYTLHAIATRLFESPAAKNILVNGHVLDKNGQKMSKRLGNTVDPFVMIERYGADAVRWYLVTNSPVWKSILFNEEDIPRTVIADFFRALTNTYSFFARYANIDGFRYQETRLPVAERAELDRWILSELNSTIAGYREHMDQYDPTRAMRMVSEFSVEQLSNWYVRRNRRRFWKSEMNADKLAAYQTLYECLLSVVKMMAPLAPFLSDHLYRALNETTLGETVPSVHLSQIPEADHSLVDAALERRMERAQTVVALARMLREKSKLKVRQPLRRILLPVSGADEQEDYGAVEEIIKDELNVKAVEYVDAGASDVVRRKAKPNFKAIGPRFGKQAKAVAAAITAMTGAEITALLGSGSLTLTTGNDSFDVFAEDVEILHEDIEGWLVASEGVVTVALDTELDEELLSEGLAREFVNRVQTLRKDSGLDVTDRIRLVYDTDDALASALEAQRDYVMSETLAIELVGGGAGEMSEVEINGIVCRIAASRVENVTAG
jgi:isoleucyl-tRNA synthetase